MENLVTTLESQHRVLEQIVGEVEAAIAARDADRIGERLQRLHRELVEHLSLENRRLYPAFERANQDGRGSAEIARTFASSMRLIAEGLTAFVHRYARGPSDLLRFEREWRSMVEVLSERIAAEEGTLHPLLAAAG